MRHKEQEFNKYCADVMGYTFAKRMKGSMYYYFETGINNFHGCVSHIYNPENDLNQMAEVVEKVIQLGYGGFKGHILGEHNPVFIKKAFRDFIISTMEKE